MTTERTLFNDLNHFSTLGITGVPLWWWLGNFTEFNPDDVTLNTVSKLRESDEGVVIAPLHEGIWALDMVVTAYLLLKHIPEFNEMVLPVAALWHTQPALNFLLFEKLNKVEGLTTYSVYRAEEMGKTKRKMPKRVQVSVEYAKKKKEQYLTAAHEALAVKGGVVLTAPLGTRVDPDTTIDDLRVKDGFVRLAKTGSPIVYSHVLMRKGRARAYLSPVYRHDLAKDWDVREETLEAFAELRARALQKGGDS